VVIGKRGLAEGNVEVKLRRTGQKKDVSLSTIAELLRFAKRNARKHPSGLGTFAGIFE
jgi:prolyl-tRNA synthetase